MGFSASNSSTASSPFRARGILLAQWMQSLHAEKNKNSSLPPGGFGGPREFRSTLFAWGVAILPAGLGASA